MEEEHKVAEVEIAAPRNVVWQALRDPAEIRRWFGWETPDIEAEIAMIFVDGAEADEATGIIQFGEWEGVADRFELRELHGKTTLSVMRSGTPPEGGWEASHNEVIEGWTSFIQQLRLYLETHRGDTRRTLWLSSKSGPGAVEALGLLGVGAAGSHYARDLSPGDAVSGEVLFWSRRQVGVVVAEWSGGLLIAGDRPAGGTALLTVYGLSDAEFGALETRWKTWWSAAYS
jgi:hypothetical protein